MGLLRFCRVGAQGDPQREDPYQSLCAWRSCYAPGWARHEGNQMPNYLIYGPHGAFAINSALDYWRRFWAVMTFSWKPTPPAAQRFPRRRALRHGSGIRPIPRCRGRSAHERGPQMVSEDFLAAHHACGRVPRQPLPAQETRVELSGGSRKTAPTASGRLEARTIWWKANHFFSVNRSVA